MTSWSWWRGKGATPRRCGNKWQPYSPNWGCGCRWRRPAWSMLMRASTSSACTSAVSGNEERRSTTSTPNPSRKAIQAVKDKVKVATYRSTRQQGLDELILSLNRKLAGWANHFRYGVSKASFNAVDYHAWGRIMRWIRAKSKGTRRLGMKELRRRFCDQGRRFAHNGVVFTGASSVAVTRYRY